MIHFSPQHFKHSLLCATSLWRGTFCFINHNNANMKKTKYKLLQLPVAGKMAGMMALIALSGIACKKGITEEASATKETVAAKSAALAAAQTHTYIKLFDGG